MLYMYITVTDIYWIDGWNRWKYIWIVYKVRYIFWENSEESNMEQRIIDR